MIHRSHEEAARRNFAVKGYNCAQSLFCAYADEMGFDENTCIRLACSFGGGMGRLREVCGAMSGALMVLGVLHAPNDPTDLNAKAEHYRRVQEFAARFKASQGGTYICRELLGDAAGSGFVPEARTAQYYSTRPCERIVGAAAEILDALLIELEGGENHGAAPV